MGAESNAGVYRLCFATYVVRPHGWTQMDSPLQQRLEDSLKITGKSKGGGTVAFHSLSCWVASYLILRHSSLLSARGFPSCPILALLSVFF